MSKETKSFFEFGPFRLDSETGDLWVDEDLIALEPRVADTLLALVRAQGRVAEKASLVRQIWGAVPVTDSGLTRNIYVLRKTLGKYLTGKDCIDTVPTRGYRFTLPVTERLHKVPQSQTVGAISPSVNNDGSQQYPDIDKVPDEAQKIKEGATSQVSLTDEEVSTTVSTNVAPHPQIDPLHSAISRMHRSGFSPKPLWGIAICIILISTSVLAIWWPNISVAPAVARYTQLSHDGRVHGSGLLTDGSHIYFEENADGKTEIAEVSVSGGETVHIPTPFSYPQLLSLFPGDSALLISARDSPDAISWKLPLPGGSPQPLPGFQSPAISISPDGHRAAYIENQGRTLVVANSDGSLPHRIYSISSGSMANLCWSANGKKLSFLLGQPDLQGGVGMSSFWSIAPDGANLRVLIPPSTKPLYVSSWTPDGNYFIFDSFDKGRFAIWALRDDNIWFPGFGHKPIRLTSEILNFSSPMVSLDGTKIFALGKQDHGQLVRYDRKTGYFLPYLNGISAGSANFTRDGKWITYVSHPEGTLWRSRVDGTERLQLTFAPIEADSPHWSPKGERIAYRASTPGNPKKIFLISRNGGIPEELRPENHEEEGVPTWSSEGDSLVFGDLRFHPEKIAIHIMDLQKKKITDVPGSEGLWTPRWSPDGRFLLALKADALNPSSKKLLIFDFHTQQWKTLVEHSINEPVWSHDGKYIYFDLASGPKDDAIFRVTLEGKLEPITSLANFPRVLSHSFGNWLGLSPDDSPLLLRDARQTEIYALDMHW